MKSLVVRSLVAACAFALLPLPLVAQTSGSASTSSIQKPISSIDRKFIKDSGEQVLSIIRLVEMTKYKGPGSEGLKSMNAKINSDMDKIWGDVGTFAQAHKTDLPKTEPSANDKAQLAKIRKTDESKFDQALLKVLDKETKKVVQIFETGEKSVQDPELKSIIAKWTPTLKKHAEDVAAAEAEAKKKK